MNDEPRRQHHCICGKRILDEGTCIWCGHGNVTITTYRQRSSLPEPVQARRRPKQPKKPTLA